MGLGFELAQSGSANQYANAFGETKPVDQLTPSTFEGVGRAVGMGIARGGTKAAQAVSMALGVLPVLQDKLTGGTERSDIYFERHDRIFNRATEYWTPRPDEVGAAGRVLGGLAEMALPLAAGGGNPTLLMGSAGLGAGEDLVRQGVDASTARAVGTVQALSLGIGFKLPFLGRNLMERVAFGAGSNVAVGAGAAAVSSAQLTKEGYAEAAKQFDPFDAEARGLDVLMGAVFGGIAHMATPRTPQGRARTPQDESKRVDLTDLPESTRDALLTANNASQADVETAPGRPRTIDAANDHADALAQAMDELDAGLPVTAKVDPAVFEAAARYREFHDGLAREVDAERGGPLREEAVPSELVRYYHGGNPEGVDGPLWFTSDLRDAQGWASRDPSMRIWHVAVPKDSPLRGGDPAYGVLPPSRIELPAEIANRRQLLDDRPAPTSAREPTNEAAKTDAPPEITAAARAVAENPDLHITLEDGTVTRAADALKQADEIVAQAEIDSRAFEAAVACEIAR